MPLNFTNILPIFCLIFSYIESAENFCEKDFCQENGVKIYSELNGLDQYDPKLIEKLKNDILVKPKKGPLNLLRPPQPKNLKGRGTIKEFLGFKATLFMSIWTMALLVMEFQDQGYKIRKIFA